MYTELRVGNNIVRCVAKLTSITNDPCCMVEKSVVVLTLDLKPVFQIKYTKQNIKIENSDEITVLTPILDSFVGSVVRNLDSIMKLGGL